MKTRLIGALTAEEAAQLHGAFVADVVSELTRGDFDLRVAWALDSEAAPDEKPPDERLLAEKLLPNCVPGMAQQGANLGERLHCALSQLARAGYSAVAAVGSDHPEIEAATVERGFQLLAEGHDVVLGPARDGGYTLIVVAASRLRARLFDDIAWSGPTVLATTLLRCQEEGLSAACLPEGDDIDTEEDLVALCRRLEESSRGCPRTRELLRSWGRIST